MNVYDCPTIKTQVVNYSNAQHINLKRMKDLHSRNRRYEATSEWNISMRETRWLKRGLLLKWKTFLAILKAQKYRCACCHCDIDERASVDKDVVNDSIRGLLCFNCNIMLAIARDNPHTLLQGIFYLLNDGCQVTLERGTYEL